MYLARIVFSAYTKWVVFCVAYCMMQSAMMAYINVQCILDCLPVSVSTEQVYSDDQFANSYSIPYKLYINGSSIKNYSFAGKYMLPCPTVGRQNDSEFGYGKGKHKASIDDNRLRDWSSLNAGYADVKLDFTYHSYFSNTGTVRMYNKVDQVFENLQLVGDQFVRVHHQLQPT